MTVTDTWNVRLVILALAIIVVTCLVGIIYLTAQGRDPGDLKLIGSAALGGLTGILATTRTTPIELPPADDPVPAPPPDA